jgi:hypothetical protein
MSKNNGPKVSKLWIRDTRGYPSLSVTLVVVAFTVTTLAYVLSIVEKIGPLQIRAFDVQACGVYLVPILCHYWARKQTDSNLTAKMGIAPGAPVPPPANAVQPQ